MSLRELARKHLATLAKPMLSQAGQYRDVPAGQDGSSPYSSGRSAVPSSVPGGTANRDAGTDVPLGTVRDAGTSGTLGTVGTVGTVGTRPVISLDERRAAVAALLDRMEAEGERRRDWHAQPVEGWREGRLTLRNIVRDETVVVDFMKWRARR